MTWTYSGDPSASDLDKYRFFIGDTDADEPILQDGEIMFVVNEHENHNERLYLLYDAAADYFARQIERKVGPIEEKPTERLIYFRTKANYYRSIVNGIGLSLPKSAYREPSFRIGMNDNARY